MKRLGSRLCSDGRLRRLAAEPRGSGRFKEAGARSLPDELTSTGRRAAGSPGLPMGASAGVHPSGRDDVYAAELSSHTCSGTLRARPLEYGDTSDPSAEEGSEHAAVPLRRGLS